ncbi:ensconsin-like [Mizuhopecten yessoensis]|uniref:Uncharacterized protein n=1 Tax=Mizuhopecten yessoensis TaxID=6573 RepID=A0A210PF43_MIZYE|nr:ensconsin-like [Mizuhopecten yessoensis]OWF35104.1 hypothetical protein KP79_PYT10939 [Mizuhopecten yessoensis]
MGCINTKSQNEDRKKSQTRWQRLCNRIRRKHKVGPSNGQETTGSMAADSGMETVPLSLFETTGTRAVTEVIRGSPRGVPVEQGTPMLNIARKAEDIIMEQLKAEGIVPRKARGGVAFDIRDNVCKPSKTKIKTNVVMLQPIPGAPQYTKEESVLIAKISAAEGISHQRPRLLPPLAISYTSEEKEIMADIIKNEEFQAKGHMARISNERRELARERREKKEMERREKVDEKMMKCPVNKDGKGEKMKIDEKLERARLKREIKQQELKAKVERKISRSESKPQAAKERSNLKQKKARANRELMLVNRRDKWLRKRELQEEAKRRGETRETTMG